MFKAGGVPKFNAVVLSELSMEFNPSNQEEFLLRTIAFLTHSEEYTPSPPKQELVHDSVPEDVLDAIAHLVSLLEREHAARAFSIVGPSPERTDGKGPTGIGGSR